MHLVFTFSILVLGQSAVAGSPLSVLEALADDNGSDRIEVEGWVSANFEDFNLCLRQFEPRNACLWIELSESSNSIHDRIAYCRKEVEWFYQYHGSHVVLRGVLVKGSSGHLGASKGKITNPEVIKVISPGPGDDQEYVGNCYEFLEQIENSTYNKSFKQPPAGGTPDGAP